MKPCFLRYAIFSALLATTFILGCGRDNPLGRKALSGNVKMDGGPLPKGAIEFHPLDGGVQTGGLIENGGYSVQAHEGATPGKYRVVIYDTYETPPLPPGHMPGDDIPKPPKPKVPPGWNTKSNHEIEVKKEGPFKFDFEIDTKKK